MKLKFILCLILLSLLQGCFYQSVSSNEYNRAMIVCSKFSGVEKIKSYSTADIWVHCNDGSEFKVPPKITKE